MPVGITIVDGAIRSHLIISAFQYADLRLVLGTITTLEV